MSQKPKIGNPNILDKPVPKNPKYGGVKSTLDTGASMPKHLEKLEKSGKLKEKKDELFKRVKVGFVAGLIMHEEMLIPQVPTNGIINTNAAPITRVTTAETLAGTSLYPSSQIGQDELPALPTDGYPSFLLLDVRVAEEYEKCRIKGAITYPATVLTHAMNYFTADIYKYKNRDGKYIIVYDEDESIASKAATSFFQKGVDNIFMLHGGMREMHDKFPDLVVGDMPPKPDTPKLNSRASTRAGTTSSTSSKLSTKSTTSTPSSTLHKTASGTTKRPSSTASNLSTASMSSTKAWK